MFIFLKSKKQSLHSEKKKVNKDTTIVLEVCSPWILTRFRWERGPGLGGAGGMERKAQRDTKGQSRVLVGTVRAGTGDKPLLRRQPPATPQPMRPQGLRL